MDNLAWFNMGGYASTVWSSYAIVFGVLLIQGFITWKSYKNACSKS